MGLPEPFVDILAGWAASRFAIDPVVNKALDTLPDWIADRIKNVVERGREKAAGRGLDPGERTAWAVFDAAWRNDQSIVADYLGGVLAASNDDTGVPVAALIERLSTLDLRLHFVLYRSCQPFVLAAIESDPETHVDPDLYVSKADLLDSCGLPHSARGFSQLEQSLRNLGRERLVGQAVHNGFNGSPFEPFVFSAAEIRRWYSREPPEPGVVFAPSDDGMSLLAWGAGIASRHVV